MLEEPDNLIALNTNNPKEAIMIIVENNNKSAEFRSQLIQLINKIKAIQGNNHGN